MWNVRTYMFYNGDHLCWIWARISETRKGQNFKSRMLRNCLKAGKNNRWETWSEKYIPTYCESDQPLPITMTCHDPQKIINLMTSTQYLGASREKKHWNPRPLLTWKMLRSPDENLLLGNWSTVEMSSRRSGNHRPDRKYKEVRRTIVSKQKKRHREEESKEEL